MPYDSLLFVDQVGSNFLYRGPEPLLGGQFDYAGLTDAINSQPIAPPSPYYLVEISLLHSTEVENIGASLQFWQQNPNLGQFNLWDTYGTPVCVFATPSPQRETLSETLEQWLPDPLVWRVATIRNWLEGTPLPTPQPTKQPLVIYVHCDGGCDRTGEMIGAYMLRYLCPWKTMWDVQPCERPMGCNNYRAVEWYAFWLNATQGFNLTGIGEDGGCYDPDGTHKPCSPQE